MTDEPTVELKKLSKQDLVEMLYEIIGEMDDLRDRLAQVRNLLDFIS